jgi:nitrate/nitrite transport system substrate-binding protein
VHERVIEQRSELLMDAMGAILKACRWLESAAADGVASTLSQPEYLGCPVSQIAPRLEGRYQLGLGLESRQYGEDRVRFFRGGLVNPPRRAHALWFLAQYRRFGLLEEDAPYQRLVDQLLARDLYERVADREHIELPSDDMRSFEITLDGAHFDPRDLAAEVSRG